MPLEVLDLFSGDWRILARLSIRPVFAASPGWNKTSTIEPRFCQRAQGADVSFEDVAAVKSQVR